MKSVLKNQYELYQRENFFRKIYSVRNRGIWKIELIKLLCKTKSQLGGWDLERVKRIVMLSLRKKPA